MARVLRGRAETLAADREALTTFVDRTPDAGTVGVRVWRPHRHVAFGRRDANREGYDLARERASERGYPLRERAVGGHAVAFTGSTAAFAYAQPVAQSRTGIQERYDRISARIADALTTLDVSVTEGEPDGAFCPGTHSLSADGKIVGLAQRVHSDVAIVSGIVVVSDHEAIGAVLDPVYDALSLSLRREAIGSIGRAGGVTDFETVREAIEQSLLDGADPEQVPIEACT